MKTFLPVVSPTLNPWQTMRLSLESLDNKRLGKQRVESYQIWRVITGLTNTKSWRLSPAIHMWRGYPHALGVYIRINCAIWASRKSATTGKYFSNAMMDQHIQTFGFGRNDLGAVVAHDIDLAIQAAVADESAATAATTDVDPAVAAAATAAAAAAPIAIAAPPQPQPAALPQAQAQSAQRSGTYVDGIRIPWWFHDMRIHDSDAAILHQKDPSFYSAFREQGKRYDEYVWPRDIDPAHPEQKEELDALAATLEQEAKAKEAEGAAKKKNNKKKNKKKTSATQDSDENDAGGDDEQSAVDENEAKQSESVGSASASSAAAATTAAAAASASTPRKVTRSVSRKSPDASQLSPTGVTSLSAAPSPIAFSPSAKDSPAGSARPKRRRAALEDNSAASLNAQQTATDPAQTDSPSRAKRRIRV